MDGVVVVGASLGGLRTAQALRRLGYDGSITLIGAEPHRPYDRPPLSKEFLLGKLDPADLALAAPGELGALGLQLRLGEPASAVDPVRRRIRVGDDEIGYDTLVVATGSTPRPLPGAAGLDGVHTLRSIDDAQAIQRRLAAGARVAVVGGGFIGAEVASSARSLGLDVTIIDPLPTLMVRGLGATIGHAMSRRHQANGVTLRLGRTVHRVEGAAQVERLVLDDGSSVEADVVVVGIGADPALSWLTGSGLPVDGGLVCDATLRVAEAVYAVGDVARWTPADGGASSRLEHWTNVVDQAQVVARGITGNPVEYAQLPYVWSDQLGDRLQILGHVRPGDEVVYLHGSPTEDEFVAVSGGEGRLRAVTAFGARREAMRAQKLLRAGVAWRPGRGPDAG